MTDLLIKSEPFTSFCIFATALHCVAVKSGKNWRVNFNKINQPILTTRGKKQGQVDDCMFWHETIDMQIICKIMGKVRVFVVGHDFSPTWRIVRVWLYPGRHLERHLMCKRTILNALRALDLNSLEDKDSFKCNLLEPMEGACQRTEAYVMPRPAAHDK